MTDVIVPAAKKKSYFEFLNTMSARLNMTHLTIYSAAYRSLGYERVYLPLCKVADTPFHIQGDDILIIYHACVRY